MATIILIVIVSLQLTCAAGLAEFHNEEDHLLEFDRILHAREKRDLTANLAKDDPKAKCRNGGIFAGNMCHCIHPHTGDTCQDFACVHGISVGRRYDPKSLFFSSPCICNEGWKGELCEYHLTDRCSNRGEWKQNKCECIDSYFGNECQYTSRCDNGYIKHGRCICHQHFDGDFCQHIVCYHGYANTKNYSKSCICPVRYKGLHCNECSQNEPKIQPYPVCKIETVHHRKIRKQVTHQVDAKSRFYIMGGAIAFLVVIMILMCSVHICRQRKKNPQEEARRQKALSERQAMLQNAVLQSQTLYEEPQPRRKLSLTNPFKLKRSQSPSKVTERYHSS